MDHPLSKFGVKSGNQFDCDDFVQHLQFKVVVVHSKDLKLDQFDIVSEAQTNDNIQKGFYLETIKKYFKFFRR